MSHRLNHHLCCCFSPSDISTNFPPSNRKFLYTSFKFPSSTRMHLTKVQFSVAAPLLVSELSLISYYYDSSSSFLIFMTPLITFPALSTIAFEKVCVLFNIAALQSSIASTQCLDSDEGLKTAAKLFQQAAGIFGHLKSAAPALGQEPTPDLSPDTLHVLSNLMLTQAQEIFVIKAIKDGMKDQVIAKLASQGEEMYADVLKSMQKDSLKALWDKDWIPIIAGKQAGFHGLTMLYQSAVFTSAKKIGQGIAALQKAVELFKASQSRSGKATLFDEFAKKAQRNLVEAKKENDFIYNATIPSADSLESSGKFQLAKALPITTPMSSNFKDLFSDLVPVALQQAMNACDSQKNEIVNAEVMKLRDATQTLNGVLSSLNLPAAIEVNQPGSSLPPSLLEKANDLRDKGGIQSIRTLIEELPESLTRNKEILDETERMLKEEQESDAQLRTQFKERWTRTSSDKLNEMFRTSAGKYREIINNAISADKVVRQKFEDNSRGIDLLSKSPQELHQAIPAGAGCVSNSPAVAKLRTLMEAVETIKVERDVIEAELKSATVDMKDQFLHALAQDGAIDPNNVVSHVGKSLSPLQKQVVESVGRQQSLISDIQQAHQQFTAECGSGSNQRDQLLSQLASAYDIFTELQHNLKEGTKFYNDLTQLLIVFQNKVSDFCFARKTEKEELLKDLTAESSRQAAGVIPAIPGHHGKITRNHAMIYNLKFFSLFRCGTNTSNTPTSSKYWTKSNFSRERSLSGADARNAITIPWLQLHAANADIIQSLRNFAARWNSLSGFLQLPASTSR